MAVDVAHVPTLWQRSTNSVRCFTTVGNFFFALVLSDPVILVSALSSTSQSNAGRKDATHTLSTEKRRPGGPATPWTPTRPQKVFLSPEKFSWEKFTQPDGIAHGPRSANSYRHANISRLQLLIRCGSPKSLQHSLDIT